MCAQQGPAVEHRNDPVGADRYRILPRTGDAVPIFHSVVCGAVLADGRFCIGMEGRLVPSSTRNLESKPALISGQPGELLIVTRLILNALAMWALIILMVLAVIPA